VPTTTGHALPYPATTDSPDGPAQILALCNRLETLLTAYDNTLAANTPHIDLTRSTTQAISDVTLTDISWTVENSDRNGLFTVTGTTFTAGPASVGVWDLSAWMQIGANATGFRSLQIYHNGAVIAEARHNAVTVASQPTSLAVATTRLIANTDTLKVAVFHTAGTSLNIASAPPPRFALTRIGA